MTVFHVNLMIEPPKGVEPAPYAAKIYDEIVQLFIKGGCAAVGAIHAAPDKGCGCNVLTPNTVREAAERGLDILKERGQAPLPEKS